MHIRIIPMSMEDSTFVGKSIKEVQDDYFNDYLINVEKGWYFYAKSGLNANEGDLLLFQMSNSIIASATLYDVITLRLVVLKSSRTVSYEPKFSSVEYSITMADSSSSRP